MLSRSETMVSRLIGLFTCEPYTHASIAFNENLTPMEYADRGYYKEHYHIPCALYAFQVSDEIYNTARTLVRKMMDEQERYTYNVLGLLLCKLNIAYSRPYHYFCSEFVSNVLEKSHALKLPKPPSLMRPCDYTHIPELTLMFKGEMHELVAFCAEERVS